MGSSWAALTFEPAPASFSPMSEELRQVRLGRIRGLYGMVDLPRAGGGVPAGRLARQLLDGGAQVLQLRMKGAPAAAMLAGLGDPRPPCPPPPAALVVHQPTA